jgi:cyclic pyranopterin phosphate synthase
LSDPGAGSRIPTGRLSLGACAQTASTSGFHLVDLARREVRYLRLSLTDRCNYRCVYCMPAEGVRVASRADLLEFGEIERLVRLFVGLGIRHLRLTGGEPLVRRDVVELVRRVAAVPDLADLAMTTNAHLLPELAAPLREAGLRRLNVSLDTLDPDAFATLTRGGDLARVLAGLRAARDAGFDRIKLNAVVVRGRNEADLPALAAFAAGQGHVLRCIEFMPIGLDDAWSGAEDGTGGFLPADAMRARLREAGWQLQDDPDDSAVRGGGPARYQRALHPDHGTLRLGFITAVSDHFCETCNRVRVSATGVLRECLSAPGRLSLRDAMRAGLSDAELTGLVRDALLGKVAGHRFMVGEQTREAMSSIGG